MNTIFHLASIGALALIPTVAGETTTTTKLCVELEVPVPVRATNQLFDQPRVDSTIDAIDWTVWVSTRTTPPVTERLLGNKTIDDKFLINAQLCVPSDKGPKADILQIATPGLGFDKRYFDAEIQPDEYSYVNAALKKGYSILTYDRLGTGKSQKPNAYDIVQIPTEIEILASLTKIARSGKLISSSKVLSKSSRTISDFVPSKVVQIGYSFGSFLIQNVVARYPELSDGAILTALYPNTIPYSQMIDVLHYDHEFPKENDPARFSEYGSGYFVLSNEADLQKLFFQKKSLDPALLTYTEKIKQPETVGEYASEGLSSYLVADNFKGPVHFFIGEFDNFVCRGDCRDIYNQTEAERIFPHSNPTYYLQPETGHAPALSKNASAGFEVMLGYLDSHNL
ncbi:unnamed protein product [Clonostachys rosea]|uniref:AB hydrolase-1 domain-containing protein n=1 Tax=Bionectria ochroleuca TaxID=29856 RepID=A0ABY6U0L6_BIOOC|nr:unnamed protein product [Clonostachys rosea]